MAFRLLLLAAILLSIFGWRTLPVAAQQDDPAAQTSIKQNDEKQNDDKQDNAASSRQSEESSSKDTQVDLAPPKDDAKNHPMSSTAVVDAEGADSDVQELHPWDPHKAAKDVEVGDFYFRRKNYKAALDRYKEALLYKDNDAMAN